MSTDCTAPEPRGGRNRDRTGARLSLVVPFFNEQEALPHFFEAIKPQLGPVAGAARRGQYRRTGHGR
ncbi:hypothetical protein Salmuc_00400 [Salipiger mucosus DSM 16094]|uniref:Uncharacterized protein n=1 Tax=Salipiger mucosus DSM 16094 TaxID=1123237 RepID=S9QAC7_9RHOB|nr:hypothetical protein Salmuc_00400 [Salipiger mucosus DSM 16094]